MLLSTGAIKHYDADRLGPPVCILPLLVTEDGSGAFRLCWDGRYTNSFIRLRHIKYETLDVLRLLLQPETNGAAVLDEPTGAADLDPPMLLKIDFTAGYHHVLMQRGTEPFLAFAWNGAVYYWRALPFGLCSVPEVFEYLMQHGFRRILRGPLATPHMGMLDDSGVVLQHARDESVANIVKYTKQVVAQPQTSERGPPVPPCLPEGGCLMEHTRLPAAHAPAMVLGNFTYFGGSINLKKLEYGRRVEMLGILVDTQERRTYVPLRRKDKLMPLLQQVDTLCPGSRIPVRLLSEIAGQLVSMFEALRFAKQLLWSVFYTIYPFVITDQWDAFTSLPETVRDTCHWWLHHFDKFNGRDFFESPRYNFEWDAAKSGAGAVLYGNGKILCAHVDRPLDEWLVHNDVWELVAAPELLCLFGDILTGHRLAMYNDNIFALSYLKRGGGPNPGATAMIQLFFQWLIQLDIELVKIGHIPGKLLWMPDFLSRFQDYSGDWALTPEVWLLVEDWWRTQHLPFPTIEGFASSLNHRLSRWVSRWVEPGAEAADFFAQTWQEDDRLWLNPPFGLLLKTLLHIACLKLSAYLVIPHWPDKSWWYPAWALASTYMTLPPNAFTTIKTGHQAGFHDPGYHIYVLAIRMPGTTAGVCPPM